MGFPQTLSGAVIFLYLFICIREPSVCDVVFIRKREDTGNETLGMSVCVWWPSLESGVVSCRISTCFLAAISLQGKEKSSSLLTFLYCIERVVPAIIFWDCLLSASVVLSHQYHDQVSFHFLL